MEAIAAYEDRFGVTLTIWERRLLCRIDDAVIAVLNVRGTKRNKRADQADPQPIPMTNGGGIKQFFLTLQAAKRAKG